jgi:hypothetical protein
LRAEWGPCGALVAPLWRPQKMLMCTEIVRTWRGRHSMGTTQTLAA